MLQAVHVRDLVLIEAVDLELDSGLNVISGATGEGKSLLLLGVALLLGGRAKKGLVREGAPQAVIEGLFRIPPGRLNALTDLITPEADELVLRRVVATDGQSRAYINGSLCPVGLLERIGEELVDVHGQRHTLLKPAEQRAILDRLADAEVLQARWQERHRALREAIEARVSTRTEDVARRERLDFLRFQAAELKDLDPKEGEEGALEAELRRLSQSDRLIAALDGLAEALAESDAAAGVRCARARRELEDFVTDAEFRAFLERVQALELEALDLGREARSLADRVESDPEQLAAVEERLAALRAEARRHRVPVDELPQRLRTLELEIARLDQGILDPKKLEAQIREAERELLEIGRELWEARRAAALRTEALVHEGLVELLMERARLRFEVGPKEWPPGFDPKSAPADGPFPVRIMVAANPGQPEAALDEVASGGEMARVMLALKGALAGAHRRPLLIFDEIDAGVGARVGLPFGRRIAAIARAHQVLVVTHLPQVAAFAQRHFRVSKAISGDRTLTTVARLSRTERVTELADMLGTSALSGAQKAARQQAKALLEEAET